MNGNALSIAKTITAAGGIGVAILLAYFYWNTVGNHIDHSTDAEVETAQAVTAVVEVMRNQTTVLQEVRNSLEDNTRVLEKLNYTLK